jgi:hypothetical protein
MECEGVPYNRFVVRYSRTDGARRRITVWSPACKIVLGEDVRRNLFYRVEDIDPKRPITVWGPR